MKRGMRPSASVILWRPSRSKEPGGSGIEVFWVKRSPSLAFLPGWHAFPGGAVDSADATVPVTGSPEGLSSSSTCWPPPPGVTDSETLATDGIAGLVVAALRELFEETGLLLARPPVDRHLEEQRQSLLDGKASFLELTRALGAELFASDLVFAGRWQTPPFSPLRFDNRFFLLPWTSDSLPEPRVLPGELSRGEWIEPELAVKRWSRGEALLAPPNLHILEVLSDNHPDRALEALRVPLDADLGPYRRIEMVPGVQLFPLPVPGLPPATHTNSYLMGFGESVLLDPATATDSDRAHLLEALQVARDRLNRSVTAIWLSHHHRDHVEGVAALKAELGVPVLAHGATAQRLPGLVDGELRADTTTVLSGPRQLRMEILHTPGHAPGHLCFWLPDSSSLVVGDMASALSTVVIDPPEGHMGDYFASLEKLLCLKPRVVFPGHGPPLHPGAQRLEQLLDHRRWREQLVLETWMQGKTDLDDLVEAVYHGTSRDLWSLAKRQVEAHLNHLAEQGRI